jgi:UrcA family protein
MNAAAAWGLPGRLIMLSLRKLLQASVAAFGIALAASPSNAQGYNGPYDNDGQNYQSPPEQVYVYGPRRPRERSEIGAPIEDVAISRAVRFDDLDLRTAWGADELRDRILYTARNLCRQLDSVYPSSFYPATSDSPPCYKAAVEDAMAQADEAIGKARGYTTGE